MSLVRPKIVSLLETTSGANLASAKSTLNAFVNMFQPHDKFAILSHTNQLVYIFPTFGKLAEIGSPTLLTTVATAIQAFNGGTRSNIGEAIKAANDLLKNESAPRAEVLLCDGISSNDGPDPLSVLPKDIPVYTIALGDNGQLELLREIARRTGGHYLFTPNAIGLAGLYFDTLGSRG